MIDGFQETYSCGIAPKEGKKLIFQTEINGLPVQAEFSEENIREIFLPLLRTLTALQKRLNRRILVFLAAPPGAGKSTLAAFLKALSRETDGVTPLTVIGMDGFHRRQEYLQTNTALRDGKEIPMVDIKGAPITFDLEMLKAAVQKAAAGEECDWPEYDRLLHNPVYRGLRVTGEIVLLEGNYLLLDQEGWRDLKQFADYTIRLDADTGLLRRRLVERKTASGMPRERAETFVDFSDLNNVRLCREKSLPADRTLLTRPDGSLWEDQEKTENVSFSSAGNTAVQEE